MQIKAGPGDGLKRRDMASKTRVQLSTSAHCSTCPEVTEKEEEKKKSKNMYIHRHTHTHVCIDIHKFEGQL